MIDRRVNENFVNLDLDGLDGEAKENLVDTFKRFAHLDNRFYSFTNRDELGRFSFNDLEAWGEDLKEAIDVKSRILYEIMKGVCNC